MKTDDEIREYKRNWYRKNNEKYKKYREENKDSIKEYMDKYREENKEYLTEYAKSYYLDNKEEICQKSKEYYFENKEYVSEWKKNYRKLNSDKLNDYQNEYQKSRKKRDNLFRLSSNIRTLIYNSIVRCGYKKESKTYNILGCSFEGFKLYLESKFEDWMTWENYGLYNGEFNHGWDIDHIIPLSSANTKEEIIKLNNYENLQPLCSKINRDIKIDNL